MLSLACLLTNATVHLLWTQPTYLVLYTGIVVVFGYFIPLLQDMIFITPSIDDVWLLRYMITSAKHDTPVDTISSRHRILLLQDAYDRITSRSPCKFPLTGLSPRRRARKPHAHAHKTFLKGQGLDGWQLPQGSVPPVAVIGTFLPYLNNDQERPTTIKND